MGYLEQIETAEAALDPWFIYLYGEPGSGKTVLACRADRPLYLQIDRNGRRSLRNHPDLVSTPTLDCTDSPDTLEKVLGEIKRNPGKEYDKFQTLVVDSYSRYQELDRRKLEKGLSQGRKGLSENEYKINNSNMRTIMELLHDTRKNVVLVSHETEVKDDEGNSILIRPRNSEVVVGDIYAQSDALFYLSQTTTPQGVTTRKLRTISTNKIKAKNRFKDIPHEITNPDKENFWRLIENGNH